MHPSATTMLLENHLPSNLTNHQTKFDDSAYLNFFLLHRYSTYRTFISRDVSTLYHSTCESTLWPTNQIAECNPYPKPNTKRYADISYRYAADCGKHRVLSCRSNPSFKVPVTEAGKVVIYGSPSLVSELNAICKSMQLSNCRLSRTNTPEKILIKSPFPI